MEKQLVFKAKAENKVEAIKGWLFDLTYELYETEAMLYAALHQRVRTVRVPSYDLVIKIRASREDRASFPLPDLTIEQLSPDKDHAIAIVKVMRRESEMNMEELVQVIGGLKQEQAKFFNEAKIKKLKEVIDYDNPDPQHQEKLKSLGYVAGKAEKKEVGRP